MNSHQRRVKKRAFVRWLKKNHWSAAAVSMQEYNELMRASRENMQKQWDAKFAELFPAIALMLQGGSVQLKRAYGDFDPAEVKAACPDISKIMHDEHNKRVLVGNCDSLNSTLRTMKSSDPANLRIAFDPQTNMVEVTDLITGARSFHHVSNLTEDMKARILDPGLGRPSMVAKVTTSKEELLEIYGQSREVTQEEANRALEIVSPPVWLGIVRVKQ